MAYSYCCVLVTVLRAMGTSSIGYTFFMKNNFCRPLVSACKSTLVDKMYESCNLATFKTLWNPALTIVVFCPNIVEAVFIRSIIWLTDLMN